MSMASLAASDGSAPGSRRDSATSAALVGQMAQLAIGGGRNAIPVLRVGLANAAGKFLTAETFGFKLNASSRVLKKAQLWTIYADALVPDVLYLQSHLKRFLSVEKSGRVTCERSGEQGLGSTEQFAVEPAAGGGWALRSVAWGTFLGGQEDLLACSARVPAPNSGGRLAADDWWWAPHCGAYTQLYVRHLSHAKYAVLRDNELQCTAWLPWGVSAVLSLEQTHGRVAIRASDGRYLQSNGQLVECPQSHDAPSNGNGAAGGKGPGPACLFALEVRAAGAQSGIVFRDERGAFLGVSGTRHTLRVGGTPGFGAKGPAPAPAPAPGAARGTQGAGPAPSRDEVFLLERSIAQMALKSCANGKFISSKQAGDMVANQSDAGDSEIFQLEWVQAPGVSPGGGAALDGGGGGKWRIRTAQDKLWRPVAESSGVGVQATSADQTKGDQQEQLFSLEYRARSQVAVRMPAGQWLSVKRSGCLAAAANAEPGEAESFWLVLGNRPSLVLRSDFGFLGVRCDSRTGRLEGNLTAHYFWVPTLTDSSAYTLRSVDGRGAWRVDDEERERPVKLTCEGPGDEFFLELRGPNQFAVRLARSGQYLRAEQNGLVRPDAEELPVAGPASKLSAYLFEF